VNKLRHPVKLRSLALACSLVTGAAIGADVATAHGVSAASTTLSCTYSIGGSGISPPLTNTFLFQFSAGIRCDTVMSSISMTVYLMESVAGGAYAPITSGRSSVADSTADEWSGSYNQACPSAEAVSVYTEADISLTDMAGNLTFITLTSTPSSVRCDQTL
jgi:hypothetical protein